METYGGYTIHLDSKKQFDLVLNLFNILYENSRVIDNYSVSKKNKNIAVEQSYSAHQARVIEELQPIIRVLSEYNAKDIVFVAKGYVDYGDARSVFQIDFENGEAGFREASFDYDFSEDVDFGDEFDMDAMFDREDKIEEEQQNAFKRLSNDKKTPLDKCGWAEMVKPSYEDVLLNHDDEIKEIMNKAGYIK